MLFNSFSFLIFFPIVILAYWLIPKKFKWVLLLIASYYFYVSWNVNLIVLIGITTLISYGSALIIEKAKSKKIRLASVLFSVISSLLILFFFKYFNFFSSSIVQLVRMFGLPASDFSLNVLLPVGISFYTFQTLSYSIDVYKGRIKAERHLGYYALFVSFFPQLVAGPIERPENLLPQLKKETKLDAQNMKVGLQYMMMGFFKKVVIADIIAFFVNSVYNSPDSANGFMVLIATLLFALQILCDFDGYTNIAIGVAKMMNIDLMKNFNNPYSAKSIKEFWGRWHISLSSWFRDYVYIPLGGNRCSKFKHLFNLFITFLLSGLWHGASWTFVIWGALHGLYQIIGSLTKAPKDKLYSKMGIKSDSKMLLFAKQMGTFALVCFAWIFFRANNIMDAFTLIAKLFTDWHFSLGYVAETFKTLKMTPLIFMLILLLVITLVQMSAMFVDNKMQFVLSKENVSVQVVKKAFYITMVLIICFAWFYAASLVGYQSSFIYFQF